MADDDEITKAQTALSEPSVHDIHERRVKPLAGALFLLITLAVGFGGGWLGALSRSESSQTTVKTQKVVLDSQGQLISSIAKNVGQSVVSVDVTGQVSTPDFFGFSGFGGGGTQTQESAGTGIILTSDGLIVTNRHVVPAGTTSVSVTLSDGTRYDNVKVVGRTSDSDSLDIAFLQIQDTKGKKLVPATIGDSSKVAVGDPVVAIGNALGQFQNTVTSGIISGHGRQVQASDASGQSSENLEDLFQTDAAINEGNSGGPLVDLAGEVIGVNVAIASNAQNVGFAIPINDVKGLIASVEKNGKLERPYLGVMYIPITADVSGYYGLSVNQGAYIAPEAVSGQNPIVPGSPAAKAGLKPGDVITQVDGQQVNQNTSLTALLGEHQVGDTVKLAVIRAGKTITLSATLAAAPDN